MIGRQEHTIWVEKYRPINLDTYIGNEHIIEKVKIYLKSNDIPHLLFYGIQGSGKTTIAKIISDTLDCDKLYINASDENGIEVIRQKIKNFASTVGFSDMKIIILDEADFLTANAQAALRNTMETFSKHTRFILTCNYIERIIPPIQSRTQTFAVSPPTKPEIAKLLSNILKTEGISFKPEDLVTIINSEYPDIRKIINQTQLFTVDGEVKIDKQSLVASNYMVQIKEILISDRKNEFKFESIRQIIADNKVNKFEHFFKYLYDELDNLTKNYDARVDIILSISKAEYQDALFLDKEINVMAMVVKIIEILSSKK